MESAPPVEGEAASIVPFLLPGSEHHSKSGVIRRAIEQTWPTIQKPRDVGKRAGDLR